jgi:hypothetical protein
LSILSIPSSVFGGAEPNTTAQAIVFAVELAIVALIAVPFSFNNGCERSIASQAGSSAYLVRCTSRCSRSCGPARYRTASAP